MLAAKRCPGCGSLCEPVAGSCPGCLMRMALGDVLDAGPAGMEARAPSRDIAPRFGNGRPRGAVETHSATDSASTTLEDGSHRALPGRQRLHHYELLEILGRGGMGTVYKAWDTRLKRHVAIKKISAGEHCCPEELRRFRREAEAAARLRHPSIVQIHEIGEENGLPFLVLEYVGGSSLAKQLTGVPWPTADAVDLVATLADAVHVAHQAGVVHRDLKPGNILIADPAPAASEAPARPRSAVRITDFGLAKLTETDKTESGVFMGTPSYCSPEQAAGRAGAIGPASDIFSLGSILYELLAGHAPFRGTTLVDTLNQVMQREPVPPRALNAAVPRDVQTICLKAMAKARGDRYATAHAFAEDLRRWRAGLPIHARHVGPLERGWRWCRRNPVVAGLLTLTAVALLAGTTVSTILAVIAQRRAHTIASVNEDLIQANDTARQSAQEAQAQARRADEQSQLALKTLESVIFDIQTKLANLPNAQHVRGDLLKTALAGLENVSAKLRADPRVDRNTAIATLNLAEVFRQVGKKSGLATRTDANLLYERATATLEALHKAAPDDPVATRDLADACLRYACNLGQTDDSGLTVSAKTIAAQKDRPLLMQALALHRQAVALQRQLLAAAPQDPEARYKLAEALTEWGYQEVRTGSADEARDAFIEAHGVLRELVRLETRIVAYCLLLGLTAARLGDYYLDLVGNGHEQAAPYYEEALQTLEKLAGEQPSDHEVQMAYAEAWSRMGDLWAARKQYDKALAAFQKELELTQALETLAPDNVELMWDASISYTHVSRELLRLKRFDEAEPILARLVEICTPLVALNPNDRRGQSLLLLAQRRLALVYDKLGQQDKAITTYHAALEQVNAYRRRTGDTCFAERVAEIEADLKATRAR